MIHLMNMNSNLEFFFSYYICFTVIFFSLLSLLYISPFPPFYFSQLGLFPMNFLSQVEGVPWLALYPAFGVLWFLNVFFLYYIIYFNWQSNTCCYEEVINWLIVWSIFFKYDGLVWQNEWMTSAKIKTKFLYEGNFIFLSRTPLIKGGKC